MNVCGDAQMIYYDRAAGYSMITAGSELTCIE